MAVYSIRELEKLSGIKAHTIRMWEKRYNLIDPHRTQTNIRYYTDRDLKKILNVAVLNRHGIKISNIARLNEEELNEEIIRVSDSSSSQENFVDSLIIATIELDDYKFLELIDRSITRLGFRDTVMDVLFPFLNKIGVFWQAGEVNPVQEHFSSYLIRQKLIAATDKLSRTYLPNSRKFMLFLPEGEWHELGLIFCQYLIRQSGHEVTYLGQSVPYSDVLAAGSAIQFDYLLVSSTTPRSEFDFITYLKDLGGAFPDKTVLYFSSFLKDTTIQLNHNLVSMDSITSFLNLLAELSQ